MSLADAIRAVDENPPPPLNLTDHPQAMRFLGEKYDERDARQREQEAADPAA